MRNISRIVILFYPIQQLEAFICVVWLSSSSALDC